MKFQYIKKNIQLLFLFVMLILSSCSENETEALFTEDSTTRTENRINELRELLKSSADGWKFTYFIDDSKFGGYTLNFRFKDDRTVEMLTDFSSATTPVESEYDITVGATVSLTFSSRNLLHGLVNNTAQGDLEFLYYGQEGDEIIFRTNRTNKEVRFSRASADDWTNILNHNDVWESFSSNHMAYVIDGKISNFVYSNSTRFASNIDNDDTLGFGLGFTSTGVIVSPAIDVNGTLYSEFTLSADARSLVSEDGNFVISLSVLPLDMSISWVTAARPGLMPQEFIDVFAVAKAAHDPNFGGAFPLNDIFNIGNSNITFRIGGAIAAHELYFIGVPGEPNQMGIIKSGPGTNWRFVPSFDPMVDLLESKSPYIVDASTPGTPILTSVADPTFAFVLIN